MTVGDIYKVDLENFAGPLDLLLYLIRKEEVNIYDIPIQRVLDQYLAYLEVMQRVNLDDAGDFMVMASTLMVIKSKMLLPVEEVDLAEELDPRYELVQQLLEYKRLKSGARALKTRGEAQGRRVGRPRNARPEDRVAEDRSLDELQIWDLFNYFSKVISETTLSGASKEHGILGRQLPVRDFASRVERRVREGPLFLSELFDASKPRSELIGFFLAVLLLVKTQTVSAIQSGEFGDIRIVPKEIDSESAEQELELEDDFRD